MNGMQIGFTEPDLHRVAPSEQQIERAQDKAVEAAQQADQAIRRNLLTAIALALGLGFLFGVFTRR